MTATAVQKLQNSQLATPTDMELLGGDVDLDAVVLEMRDKTGIEVSQETTGAQISRTVEGASSIIFTVDDDDGQILNSGKLARGLDILLDGLYFTLAGVNKSGTTLKLTFEEREVNLLRFYTSFMHADRSKVTRAQFVLRMIKEVKETSLKWQIPELTTVQPISDLTPGQLLVTPSGEPVGDFTYDPRTAQQDRQPGIARAASLTVKGTVATESQIQNAEIILRTAVSLNAPPRVMLASIMTAIAESSLTNVPAGEGDLDSVGVFQQRPSQGWPATGNVAVDSAEFIKRAIGENQVSPNESLNDLCQNVQHSGTPNVYGQYEGEATAFVRAFGLSAATIRESTTTFTGSSATADVNSTVPAGAFWYSRGTLTQDTQTGTDLVLTKENSWNCMQRLAGEVQWRCFVVSGTIWFVSETYLFQSKPFMVINEKSDGVDQIDFDFDEGKKNGTVTVTAHLSRWSAPPGSIVEITDMKIIEGRWLVNTVDRSLFDDLATITLKKPQPVLPEASNNVTSAVLSLKSPPQGAGAKNGGIELTGSVQNKIVQYASAQLGLPYQYGAEETGVAFDCSGLTQASYGAAGINIPRVAQDQYNAALDANKIIVSPQILQLGDILFFSESGVPGANGIYTDIGHVGIYIGEGTMIDAPQTGEKITVDGTFGSWKKPKFVAAGRLWQQ